MFCLLYTSTKLAGSCTANLLNGSVNYAPADDSAAETLTLAMNGREAVSYTHLVFHSLFIIGPLWKSVNSNSIYF